MNNLYIKNSDVKNTRITASFFSLIVSQANNIISVKNRRFSSSQTSDISQQLDINTKHINSLPIKKDN